MSYMLPETDVGFRAIGVEKSQKAQQTQFNSMTNQCEFFVFVWLHNLLIGCFRPSGFPGESPIPQRFGLAPMEIKDLMTMYLGSLDSVLSPADQKNIFDAKDVCF